MNIDKMVFTDNSKTSILIFYEDGTNGVMAYPPATKEDEVAIKKYGGIYQLEKDWMDHTREEEDKIARWERFLDKEHTREQVLSIDGILQYEISKADTMQIKMSMFKKDEVKQCKDKDLLTKLRKSEDIVDIIMYFGMIRCAASSS